MKQDKIKPMLFSVLKNYDVAGRRHFICHRKQCSNTGKADRSHHHGEVHLYSMMSGGYIDANNDSGNGISDTVDGQRVPRDDLDQHSSGRKEEGGYEHAGDADESCAFFNCFWLIFFCAHNEVTIAQMLYLRKDF